MSNVKLQTSNFKLQIVLALLAGFIYRMLISLQGIDHTDLGYSNTFYQNFFSNLEAFPFHSAYYLTGLIGGCWHMVFGGMGLLGFRLLEALTLTASIFMVYKAFEPLLQNTRWSVIAILVSFLFPSVVTTFHFHTLTFFFLALSVWCYASSLKLQTSNLRLHTSYLFLTGLVLGFSFFVHSSNLILAILILVPVGHAAFTHQRSLAVKLSAVMLAGMLAACAVMIGIMALLGHLSYFLNGMGETFAYFSNQGLWTAVSDVFATYYKDYINIILQLLAIVGLGALYIQSSRLPSPWGTALGIFLIVASVVLIATSLPYLSALSLYTLLCAPVFYAITPKEDKLITGFALLAAYAVPFGTGSSIASIYHWTAALLIIPASLGTYHISHILRKGVLICTVYIAGIMLWKALSYPYGETAMRWECTEQVGNSNLNTFTTPQNADDYRHILTAIRQHTADNKWLVVGNQASELYYATETLPYLGSTQQETFTDEELASRLDKQAARLKQLPVVVFLKKEQFDSEENVQLVLRQWMEKHNYQTVLDDNYLTIYCSKRFTRLE